MHDVDPLNQKVKDLKIALARRATATLSDGSVTVESGADGTLHGVRLTDAGRSLSPDMLVKSIVALHRIALADAGKAVEQAMSEIGTDQRIRDERERYRVALERPYPRKQQAVYEEDMDEAVPFSIFVKDVT